MHACIQYLAQNSAIKICHHIFSKKNCMLFIFLDDLQYDITVILLDMLPSLWN